MREIVLSATAYNAKAFVVKIKDAIEHKIRLPCQRPG